MQINNKKAVLNAVILSFFVMGFVDIVGISTSYIKLDFGISDSLSNLLPSMIFLWFLLLSIPIGMLMNRIGCRNAVIWGILISALGLLLPFLYYDFKVMLFSFSLLGIGNTFLQVSLNPLLATIVKKKNLSGFLTLGQFVKAIASFTGPILASWVFLKYGDWKVLFLLYIAFCLFLSVYLYMVKIEECECRCEVSLGRCLSLLNNKFILLLFVGIICHVGLDVGINVTLPKIFIDRLHCDIATATFSSSLYFLFRTLGCLLGFFVLAHYSIHKMLLISIVLLGAGLLGILTLDLLGMLYVAIACLGLGNANLFSIIISQALLYKPENRNEISGLMVMGLVGGAIFPLMMGVCSDWFSSQSGAILIMFIGFVYLVYLYSSLRNFETV